MSTTFSDGTRHPGTRRNEELYRELRTARQISASGRQRRRDHGHAAGRNAQARRRVDDNIPSTFGFQRLLDVLGHMLPRPREHP